LRFFLKRARKLRKRTGYYLRGILPIPDAPHAVRVAKNILKIEKALWKFLEDPLTIPLTNNHAERQIRHYVVYHKNAYFTQSERGNRFLERIISLYLSWKQQKLNPFHILSQIIET
jgi:transposase